MILVAPADELNLKQVVICGINRRVLFVTLAQILQFFNAIFISVFTLCTEFTPCFAHKTIVWPNIHFWEYFPAVMVSLKTQQEKLKDCWTSIFTIMTADAQLQSKVPKAHNILHRL